MTEKERPQLYPFLSTEAYPGSQIDRITELAHYSDKPDHKNRSQFWRQLHRIDPEATKEQQHFPEAHWEREWREAEENLLGRPIAQETWARRRWARRTPQDGR